MNKAKFVCKLKKYFSEREIFPQRMITTLQGCFIWGWMDYNILRAVYLIRRATGIRIFINYDGLQNCGFRPAYSTTGSQYSAHRIGKALDLHTRTDEELEVIIEFVRKHWERLGITEIEDPRFTPGWFHISTRETGRAYLVEVRP